MNGTCFKVEAAGTGGGADKVILRSSQGLSQTLLLVFGNHLYKECSAAIRSISNECFLCRYLDVRNKCLEL